MLVTIPFGVVMDRIGRKSVLWANTTALILAFGWITLIGEIAYAKHHHITLIKKPRLPLEDFYHSMHCGSSFVLFDRR